MPLLLYQNDRSLVQLVKRQDVLLEQAGLNTAVAQPSKGVQYEECGASGGGDWPRSILVGPAGVVYALGLSVAASGLSCRKSTSLPTGP